MKRICFVTTVSITLKAFILDTAIYLNEQGGYDITFICDYDVDFAASLPDHFNYRPVAMKRGISLSGIKSVIDMYRIFKTEKFDIVQYSTPNASFYASIASKLAGIPVRLYCQWGIAYVGFTGFKKAIFKLIEKTVSSLSTHIRPDSVGNLNFSQKERLYKKDKGAVIWNGSASGVDLKKFNINYKEQWRESIRERHIINGDSYVMGFVGRITKDKGITELLSASRKFFELNDNAILLLIGDVEKTSLIDTELINWSIEEKRVIYCGWSTEIEKYLAAMDVFILPSYREGFGSVVIESQAMGIPVIVSNIPGPTDAMIDNETGLTVQKKDVESLYLAIVKLYENAPIRLRMGEKGFEFVKNNFEKTKLMQHILIDRNQMLNNK